MSHDYGKFMNLRFRDKCVIIFGITVILSFLFSLIISVSFFSLMGFLKVVGGSYTSNVSLLLFILICLSVKLIQSPVERLIKNKIMHYVPSEGRRVTSECISSIIMLLIVHYVDVYIMGIQLNWFNEVALVGALLVIKIAFSMRK